ncbi:MAG TPA: hypothetical protein VD794_15285 [Flavisolibacter sp.]|nr:hypothetical protein [Flavisolibacter sp.]
MKRKDDNTRPVQKESQEEINKGEQRVGRADQNDSYDISHMDQQEGAMNNGALGGNFESSVDEGSRTAGQGEERNK